MDCWCRYAPTARLVLRAARDLDALQSANASGMLFDVDVSRDTELETIPGVSQHHSLANDRKTLAS